MPALCTRWGARNGLLQLWTSSVTKKESTFPTPIDPAYTAPALEAVFRAPKTQNPDRSYRVHCDKTASELPTVLGDAPIATVGRLVEAAALALLVLPQLDVRK